MRGWAILLVGCAAACSTSRSKPVAERHDATRAIATLRSIPVLGERLRPTTELIPASLGVTLEKPGLISAIVPLTARAPMRVTRGGHSLDIVAEHDTDARGAIEAGAMVYADASASTDAVVIAEPDRVEELRVYRSGPVVARWRLHVEGSMAIHDNIVEALDAGGHAFLRTDPIFAIDSRGTKRVPRLSLTRDGASYRLEAELDVRDLQYPIALDPGWGPTAAMSTTRIRHSGVKLTDGRVLVVGGQSELTSTGVLASAEIYDPSTGTWTLTGSMKVARSWFGLTLLSDGKVMAVGGLTTGSCVETQTTEVFDPTAGTWTDGPALPKKWYFGFAHAIGTKVVVVGGRDCGGAANKNAMVLDAGTWTTSTSAETDERIYANSTVTGGKVLTTGGKLVSFGNTFDTASLFDPSTMKFTPTPKMSTTRVHHGQVTLSDGRVMIAAGKYDDSGSTAPLMNAEIFDPVTLSWTVVPGLTIKHHKTPIVQLSTGKVLIVAGDQPYVTAPPVEAEWWDPVTNAWSLAGKAANSRGSHLMFPLAGGNAIVVGGDVGTAGSGARTLTATVELFADGIATGSKCGSGGMCSTGFCVDGVCCNEACTGKCQSCTTGTCTSLSAPGPGKGTCDPYTCGLVDCKTTCTADTDCTSTYYCNKTTSKCEVRVDKGAACTTASQCKTGYCANGYCCNEACTGACQVCNQSGSLGVCVTVTGTDACAAPPDAGADTGTSSDSATMDDTATSTDTDVAPGDGQIADGGEKLPAQPVIVGEFTRCSKDSECGTGHCVEGVCCNTECLDRCHSCALISSPGICTPSPLGVDMRNDCGPALKCLGTCNGSGACIGAGAGTTCARNRCTTQSEGVGAAYCLAPGGKCDTAAAIPFKCDPYVCEPAFGACRNSCKNTLDCVNGFLCDLASGKCVAPAASDEDGGCAMGHSRETGVGFFALLLSLGMLSRRRR